MNNKTDSFDTTCQRKGIQTMGLMDEKITSSVSKSEGVEAEFRGIAAKEKGELLKELSCSDTMTYPQIKSTAGCIL